MPNPAFPPNSPPRSHYGPDAASTLAASADAPPTADDPLEVPAGQYDACVAALADRSGGAPAEAPGVTEAEAEARVVAGAYAYEQAANLARGGKIEALTFDPVSQRVGCRSPQGVTAAIRHAQTVWAEAYTAVDEEEDGPDGLLGGVLGTATSVAGAGVDAVSGAVGWVWGEAKGRTVKRLSQAVVGKNPAVLMFAAGPSVYRALVTGETSWRQATKDLFEAGSGAAGGAAGAAAGAAVGATSLFFIPVLGPLVGGAVGGLAGGLIGAGFGERGGELVADRFAPDDADALRPLAQEELAARAFAHALVPAEVEGLKIAAERVTTDKTLRLWFKLYDRTLDATGREPAAAAVRTAARELYEPLVEEVIAARPRVTMPVE